MLGEIADKTVVYTDLGITKGMRQGIDRAKKEGRIVEIRKFGEELKSIGTKK